MVLLKHALLAIFVYMGRPVAGGQDAHSTLFMLHLYDSLTVLDIMYLTGLACLEYNPRPSKFTITVF